jgi:TRAP-type uncharacterized transport system fused permease subunit
MNSAKENVRTLDSNKPGPMLSVKKSDWLSPDDTKKTLPRKIIIFLALCFGFWHVLTNIYLVEPGLWQNAIHFAGFAFLASVTFPLFGKNTNSKLGLFLDITYGLLIAAAACWVAGSELILAGVRLGYSHPYSPVPVVYSVFGFLFAGCISSGEFTFG